MLDALPPIADGAVSSLQGSGLGAKLRADFLEGDDITITRSEL